MPDLQAARNRFVRLVAAACEPGSTAGHRPGDHPMTRGSLSKILGPVALALTLTAAAPAEHPALQSLVAAEKEFAAHSVYGGMKGAFLAYLADDGVIFRPTATNGKKSWEARENPKATLAWEPSFAEVSAAGDLGYDTGPWELRFPLEADRPSLHGHFVSVWKRPAGGAWKVAVDLGVSHEQPSSGGVGSGEFAAGPEHPAAPGGSSGDLRRLDAAYSKAVKARGPGEAFAGVAATDVRLNREGSFPFLGIAAGRAELAKIRGTVRFLAGGAGLAASRDLGYTYGIAQRFEPGVAPGAFAADSSIYLHVWRRGGDRAWKLALAVLNPLPKAGQK